MARDSLTGGFDSITEVPVDTALYRRVALREQPRVTWTDLGGPHDLLLTERIAVGSAPGNAIEVADATVSRIHAELDPREGTVWVRDLGSRNGTFVENIRVTEAEVPDGGTITVGNTRLRIERNARREAVDLWPTHQFGTLVGRSTVMRELFARCHHIAALDSAVLIQGETGTGKEVIAEAIHAASSRASGPFVIVDCAALPETLLEAELFGHMKGAFTGATNSRDGAFQDAEGGTLFLDEIGELPQGMQPKLLRAVETRSARRIGESTYRKVDVRIVAATNRDLRPMVNAGAFREDLYFRLAVLPLTVPALRQRLDDIPLLVQHFAGAQLAPFFSQQILDELRSRDWPGNVRELRNFVERATALGTEEASELTSPSDAPLTTTELPAVPIDRPFKELRELWLNHLERQYMFQLLELHNRNISAAADAAGLDRRYLHRLIRKHGL
jgi:transcriptional regulator with GAF, ATPase, and Fis domain